jgi:hypothetical protein
LFNQIHLAIVLNSIKQLIGHLPARDPVTAG